MNWFDAGILVVGLLFTVIGVVRGFIREVLSLISWVLAFWVAFTYAETVAAWLTTYIDAPLLRVVAGFAALFICTLLVLTIVSVLIHKLLALSAIKGTDRALGGLFGGVKAFVVVAALMLLAGQTVLPQQMWWRESMLATQFKPAVAFLHDVLPQNVTRHLKGT